MKLSDQVCSLEIAKRLKELGVKQESMFCHQVDGNASSKEKTVYAIFPSDDLLYGREWWSAYTVAELLDLLPRRNKRWEKPDVFSNEWWPHLACAWNGRKEDGSMQNAYYANFYGDSGVTFFEKNFFDNNPANCLGKMLIHLLEQGLIKASDL